MFKLVEKMKASPLWLQFESRYSLLSDNDRRAVHMLAAALTLIVLYLMVWQPLHSWVNEEKSEFLRQESIHTWMEQNLADALAVLKKQKSSAGKRDLSAIVSGTLRQSGLTLSRVQPDKKGLGVWIEDAAYQKFLNWLLVLENQYHFTIHQVKMDRLKEEGRVKVFVHLAN